MSVPDVSSPSSPVPPPGARPGAPPVSPPDGSSTAPPVVGRYRVIPLIEEGASAGSRPHPATPEVQTALGFPGTLPPDWKARALARLGELVAERRGLRVFLETCTKCGACTDKCHYFLGTRDPKNMPVARQDLLRAVWRRHFTFAGRHFPWLVGARELDESVLEDWFRYFHQCSECRRCTVFCPSGIDTSEVTMAGREILASVGLGQHYAQEIVVKAKRVGNNLGMKPAALADVLESLEEDILEETGVAVRLPLDDPSADALVVAPSADFFAEPHVDGLIGYAKVLHEAGIRWTFSSAASEAANFALFTGNHEHLRDIAARIRDAALALGTRRLIIGECGHAWRVAYSHLDALLGPLVDEGGRAAAPAAGVPPAGRPGGRAGAVPDTPQGGTASPTRDGRGFLDPAHPRAEHVCEVTHALWKAGRIRLDPTRNAGVVATYHDSCNVARGAGMGDVPGGQFRLPRELLGAAVPRLVEMSGDTTGQRTFCCGGGAGMLAEELMDVRVKGALPRAQALAAVVEREGVTHMAAICAICKTQFGQVLPAHGLGDVRIASLHQLVGDALVLTGERT